MRAREARRVQAVEIHIQQNAGKHDQGLEAPTDPLVNPVATPTNEMRSFKVLLSVSTAFFFCSFHI